MACLLKIDPANSEGKCYPGECKLKGCGWDDEEAKRRHDYIQEHGLTLCPDGLYRLVMRRGRHNA